MRLRDNGCEGPQAIAGTRREMIMFIPFVQFTDGAVRHSHGRDQLPLAGAGLNKGYVPRGPEECMLCGNSQGNEGETCAQGTPSPL